MKKRVLAAALAAATVLSLAGCNQGGSSSGASNTSSGSSSANSGATSSENSGATSDDTSNTPSGSDVELTDEDSTLTLVAWNGNEDLNLLIDFFNSKKSEGAAEVKWAQIGDSGDDSKEKYKSYLDSGEDADILFCDAGWAQLYENMGDKVIPLSELGIDKSQYPNAYPYTLDVGTNEAGDFMGATWQATPGLFVYNAKLAEQYLGVTTPDQMQEKVKDWDTFKQTAADLKEASSGAVKMVATEQGLWQVKQCEKSDKWVKDGIFAFTGEAEAYIDFAKEFADNGWVDPNIGAWSPEWWTCMNNGDALGEFVPTWGLKGNNGSMIYNFAAGGSVDPETNEWKANDTAANDMFSACPGPAGWYWGGTYLVIPAQCNTKKTAAEFIKCITQNEANMKEYAQANGDFMNNKNAMNGVAFNNPVLIGGQDQFAILMDKADDIKMGSTITQYDADINSAFNDEVLAYCKGTNTREDILPKVNDKVLLAFDELDVAE